MLQSPLLHRKIYVEKAVHDALQWCHDTLDIGFNLVTESQGWRVVLTEGSQGMREQEIVLKKIMNEILARSLEAQLEAMMP